METAEPLDMETMLEVLKVADRLDRVSGWLKKLGSRLNVVEPPPLDVLEHIPSGPRLLEPGSSPFGPPRPVPIGTDLEEARDELTLCAAWLDRLVKKWYDLEEGEDENP